MSSLRVLRTFLAVAAEGSFTAAAHRVALTQAAVGLQMRSLESDLKRKLFTRRGKLVTLNEQGRALVPVATQIVTLYEQAQHGTQADAPLAGTVQFGAVVSGLGRLVRATLELKRRHPAVDLHVVSGKSNHLIAQVENRELDAAVVVHNPAISRPSLVWTPLYAEAMVLLTPFVRLSPRGRRIAAFHRVITTVVPYLESRSESSILDPEARSRALGRGVTTPRLVRELSLIVDQAWDVAPGIRVPTLVINSRQDPRITVSDAEATFARLGSDEKALKWATKSGHVVSVDFDRDWVAREIRDWLESHVPRT